MYSRIFLIFLFLVIFSCNTIPKNNFTKKLAAFDWLIGEWRCEQDGKTIIEQWQKVDRHCFEGSTYLYKNGQEIYLETIELIQNKGGIFYIPKVKEQNSGLPVFFKLTQNDSVQFIFENPAHDFPQKIVYKKINQDSLQVEISGKTSGEMKSLIFPMSRAE